MPLPRAPYEERPAIERYRFLAELVRALPRELRMHVLAFVGPDGALKEGAAGSASWSRYRPAAANPS